VVARLRRTSEVADRAVTIREAATVLEAGRDADPLYRKDGAYLERHRGGREARRRAVAPAATDN
jgi:hypothetical protein